MPIPNRLTVSVAGNPLLHKEARYDTTGLQAREEARDCIDRVSFLSGKILKGIQVMVVNCMGHIQSKVLLVCVTGPELECTYILSVIFFSYLNIQYHLSNVMCSH